MNVRTLSARPLAFLLAVLLVTGSLSSVLSADTTSAGTEQTEAVLTAENPTNTFDYTYENYLSDHPDAAFPQTSLPFDAGSSIVRGGTIETSFEGRSGVAKIQAGGELEFSVEIQAEGFYGVKVDYGSLLGGNRTFDVELRIDGQAPFEGAKYLFLNKLWVDGTDAASGRFPTDSRGNELTPKQIETKGWQTRYFEDTEGYYAEPFGFFFTKGAHVVTLVFHTGDIAVDAVTLSNPEALPAYADVLAGYDAEGYQPAASGIDVRIQAELPTTKSDPVLHPVFDRTSAASEPSNPAKIVMNTIGQLNWQYKGQWISWTFDAPSSGLYKIVMRARQNYKRGVNTCRRILVDGVVPFAEFDAYLFPFSNKWYVETLGGEEPYLVYLEAGPHTFEMQVAPSYPEVVRDLQTSVFDLNTFYRHVIMITGVGPDGNALDAFRDYTLDKEIPDFTKTLEGLRDDLVALRATMAARGFQQGGEAVVVDQLIRQMDSFLLDSDTIPQRLNEFKNNISAAAAWVLRLKEQPLELDWISVVAPDAASPAADKGFFDNLVFGARTFLASFFNNYTTLDNADAGNEQALEVWIGLGRNQAEIVKRLVDDDFVGKTGYHVNVNMVQQGLIPATLTGQGPDVAVFVNPNDVVNLAARKAIVDVSGYPGFAEVLQRFQKNSIVPYTYLDGTYALPVNETFLMMFYRKDIFAELGLVPPTTWKEFYDLLLQLQRSNLTAGVPSTEVMFQNLLFQQGGSYYEDGWKSTGFDKPEALSAFKQWTEFFTKYTLPIEFNVYSRFRTGEMPIAIDAYTLFNLLNVAAPEIRGMWDMVPIPGTIRADGTVDRTVTGAGNGIVMFEKTKDKDAGWAFMQWWTSAETQTRFGREIEILMGPAARFDTANIEAFQNLPWTQRQREQLLGQWSQIRMVPQTPVNYYIGRNLTNAFRRVVIKGENPRETLNYYNRDIDKEILRKRKEFGLD